MIDFGIFFDPGAMSDPEAVNAINRVCTNLPELAINHTPLEALMEKPLWLCVETKKPGKGFETGKLQIGAWLAAHWNFLESLIAAQSPDDDAHAASEAFQALEFFARHLDLRSLSGACWRQRGMARRLYVSRSLSLPLALSVLRDESGHTKFSFSYLAHVTCSPRLRPGSGLGQDLLRLPHP